jgi:hypothetical protein
MGNIEPRYENFLEVQKFQFHGPHDPTPNNASSRKTYYGLVSLEKTPTFVSMGSTSSMLGGNRG